MHSMQAGYMDKAQKYTDKALMQIEKLKSKYLKIIHRISFHIVHNIMHPLEIKLSNFPYLKGLLKSSQCLEILKIFLLNFNRHPPTPKF